MAAQILAVIIFIVMFGLIIWDHIERHIVSLGCGLLTLVLVFGVCMHSEVAAAETLSLRSFMVPNFWFQTEAAAESSSGINWATILFIAGMMLMVEGMERAGFFRWLCLTIAKAVHYKTIPIFISFMLMSAFLAMFIDSITVILFLAAVTVELAHLLHFDPIPMIISEIFCSNLGGSATMCGDPPNIIIGTSLGYSFKDFILNTGMMAGVSLIFVVLFFYFSFRKELKASEKHDEAVTYPSPQEAIADQKRFVVSVVIFAAAIVMLVTHAQTGLTVATIGVFIGAFSLLASGGEALSMIKKLDYKTLLFFIGLFVVVGGMEQTGVLNSLAGIIDAVSGNNVKWVVAIVLWLSALASAYVSHMVEVGGMKLLDGGCTDSIPLRAFAKMGYKKCVVVLTRPAGYRKKPGNFWLPEAAYHKYPAFVRALRSRYYFYNKTVEWIDRLEQEGKIFVIRPSVALPIGRTEHSVEKLQETYDIGRKDAANQMHAMENWFKSY